MTRLRLAALGVGLALLAGCDKGGPQEIVGTLPGARIRFFNFGVNAPSVNFYAGDTKLTAVSSTTGQESTLGTAYGSAGSAGLYSGVAPGQYMLTGRISATADNNVPIASVQTTLESGKAYSFFISGVYDAATKRSEAFVLEDPVLTDPDYTVTKVRFVNAIPNSAPLVLFRRDPTTNAELPASGAIAYKSGGAVVSLPSGVVDLVVRAQGSTTNLVVRTAVSLNAGRVFTITARGDATVTSTTAANRPLLDVTVNQ